MNDVLKFGGLVGMALLVTLVDTFVIGIMWQWFITPTFDIPVPPFLMLAGMILIPGIIIQPTKVANDDDDLLASTIKSIIFPLLILFIGFIFMLFAGGG